MGLLWLHQFNALLWKNFLLKIRNKGSLICEILLIVLLASVVVWNRKDIKREFRDAVVYPALPLTDLDLSSFILHLSSAYELVYVPSESDAAKRIAETVKTNLNVTIAVRGISTESKFEEYLKAGNKSAYVFAAIVFDYNFKSSNEKLPLQVKYHLRFGGYKKEARSSPLYTSSENGKWYTDQLFPVVPSERPRNQLDNDGGDPGYYTKGFLILQHAVDKAIMEYHNEPKTTEVFEYTSIFTRRMSYPAYIEDDFLKLSVNFIPTVVVVIFSITLFSLIRTIVLEKETRLKSSYWCGKRENSEKESREISEINNEYFEEEPTDLVAAISIQQLHKEFEIQNTKVVAIQNLSLNLYEGQITVLLGPNGAGKTTTLCILTGLYLPTRGKVFIRDYDISKHMVKIRKDMGLCPQEDILFSELTVSEHLSFYSKLKGVPPKVQKEDIRNMLKSFDMEDKKDSFAKSLSGGMKRKLSIMIALIGASKVVILDEPTSGMDPVSRRATWDLLQHYKRDRAILLTTHYMDEADVLGDRIAIMVKGTLRCCGSSLFLKKVYGVGYHLIMVKDDQCDVTEISALIYHHVPTAKLENDVAAELSFVLPKEYTHRFKDLFTELEDRQTDLGIASFGVSITTMEEVFFRVSDMADMGNSALRNKNANAKNWNVNAQATPLASFSGQADTALNTGLDLHCQQFYAMFLKRLLFSLRNWKLLILQILALLGFVLLFMQGLRVSSKKDESAREMDLEQYGETTVPYFISGSSAVAQSLRDNLNAFLKAKKQVPVEVQGNMEIFLRSNKTCIRSCIIALSFDFSQAIRIVTFWFNNEAYHSPSLSLSVLDNIIFKTISGPNAAIMVSNKPLPSFSTYKPKKLRVSGFAVAFNLFFGLSVFVSGFCLLTVNERVSKAKHLQFVSGVYVTNFWISALLWDFIIYLISCCLLLLLFLVIGLDLLLKSDSIMGTLVIFLLFGWSVIPFIYLLSFLFSSNASAYMKTVIIHYFVGFIGILMDLIIHYKEKPDENKSFLDHIFLYTLMVFPMHNFGMSISKYYDIQELKELCHLFHFPVYLNCTKEYIERNVYTLKEDTIGRYLLAMGITGLSFFIMIFLLETVAKKLTFFVYSTILFGLYKRMYKEKVEVELSGEAEDEDVENERKRVLSNPLESLNSTVVIKELIKIYFTYPAVLAVKNICLAIQRKECFGLLGLNGAGKSTTFQILTGEEIATSGDVFIDNISITRSVGQIMAKIGYCPQFDAVLNYMTGREIMTMYSRLWGIPERQIQSYVNNWVKSLNLEPHADKYIYSYSGGNKRKISTAIALMGNPSVVLLDEPSTGMDPVARRHLWNVVSRTRESGKAVVVTSHSMEECDALCTRLAIMVRGKFVCLGSPQHLKNKFGNIYILKAKAKSDTEKMQLDKFKEFIETTFPGSELKSENQGILNYYIPSKEISWGKVFGILEESKEKYNLEDYSVSQITLEQVFLTFATQEGADN
ncbi:phospholipid-transporting ATPase ABCA3-like isoform X1 [Erinaceus europaeus]|uniref:Phospholipid-transporting ATPase ABCA3-like isoform X1 n=1 Tax=Erinaceus europaeus TaxID=9365 RepID=A0ABM3VWW6_ERIEU|nr:phospholipid-transporting ATPase ABCA3-like isoform X1 [Erinaceus europaeus]